jgi:hypothetical protein
VNQSRQNLFGMAGASVYGGALLAAVVTFLVFSIVRENGFVDLDDVGYILDNPYIENLNWDTFVWAFTSFHEANWHPLTMLSLAFDRQIWGIVPFGFHATNLAIHCATTFLACIVFARLLRLVAADLPNGTARWLTNAGSVTASLFFGLHPLRVESVAWASERKDVLCLFFIVATIWWYLRYVSLPDTPLQGRQARSTAYWMVHVMGCCALMSKPTAVSLPLVLLIMDWYPLSRITSRDTLVVAFKEKVPLFILSLCAALLTVQAQQYAMTQAPDVDAVSRVLVACKALLFYLWKLFWPTSLAPYYPHPGSVVADRLYEFLPFAVVICIISAVAIVFCRRRRLIFPAVCLTYLVTLAPMLGIVQVGGQWVADRYSYFPSLVISLVWGAGAIWISGRFWCRGRKFAALAIIGVIVCQLTVYAAMTRQQIQVWRSTETLASREIELFPQQAGAAYHSRSKFRKENGQCGPALEDIDKALSIALRRNLKNKYAELSLARSEIFLCLGRIAEARAAVEWAAQTGAPEQLPQIREVERKLSQYPEQPVR